MAFGMKTHSLFFFPPFLKEFFDVFQGKAARRALQLGERTLRAGSWGGAWAGGQRGEKKGELSQRRREKADMTRSIWRRPKIISQKELCNAILI